MIELGLENVELGHEKMRQKKNLGKYSQSKIQMINCKGQLRITNEERKINQDQA